MNIKEHWGILRRVIGVAVLATALAACLAPRLISTLCSCFINQQTRSAIAGRHGPRVKAKPENPIQVGLWRSTNLSTIDTC